MKSSKFSQEKDFTIFRQTRNIQDLNLEFQLYKQHLQITQADNLIDLTEEIQAFQIIKERFLVYNQMKELKIWKSMICKSIIKRNFRIIIVEWDLIQDKIKSCKIYRCVRAATSVPGLRSDGSWVLGDLEAWPVSAKYTPIGGPMNLQGLGP